MAPTTAQRNAAEDLKKEGNVLFSKGKFAAAAERYTEALCLDPLRAVLFVNRAMAHKKLFKWGRVMADARQALSLDKDNMKAHYLLGVALCEAQQLEASIRHLTRALEAAREKGDAIKDDIWRELARAKYAAWQAESTHRAAAHAALKARLMELLRADEARALAAIEAGSAGAEPVGADGASAAMDAVAGAAGAAGESEHSSSMGSTGGAAAASQPVAMDLEPARSSSSSSDSPEPSTVAAPAPDDPPAPAVASAAATGPPASASTRAELEAHYAAQRKLLESVFCMASHLDTRQEVPSAFTCPLTMEVYRDPAVAPGGRSYERAALLEHLAKVGGWDPISRVPMTVLDVRPNLALRAATQEYLEEHPWAWAECI